MTDAALDAPTLKEVRAAAQRLAPYIIRSPLLRFNLPDSPQEIYLKLENLQPIGAFKQRPIGNAMLSVEPGNLQNGVFTASSGNSGLGLAWMARRLGVDATVYAPDNGPTSKLDAIRALGARVSLLSNERWWQMVENNVHAAAAGYYVEAVRNRAAMAGNGTIGLEIVEQLPEVGTIVLPFGGGGIACGIAAAIAGLKPDTRIIVAEAAAAAPLTAALKAGHPVRLPVEPSFISGAGAPTVLPEMWPLVQRFLQDTVVVPVAEVAKAVRRLFLHNRVVAEGAGAISLAGALCAGRLTGPTVCVVTGGNIDPQMFCGILNGKTV